MIWLNLVYISMHLGEPEIEMVALRSVVVNKIKQMRFELK